MSDAGNRWIGPRAAAALPISAVAALALLLGGCGGSSGSGSGAAAAAGKDSAYIVESNDTVSKGEGPEITTGIFPTGPDTDEENASGKHHVKPCRLVSVRQAEAILGTGVRRSEHLQGPTCVYVGSGREITVTLQEVFLRQLRKEARRARPVKVRGRTGWCLRYEKTSVAVAVHHHEVLVVGGPCQAGVHFAADALAKLL